MHGASSITFKGLAGRLKYLNSLQLLVSNGSEFEFFIFSLIYWLLWSIILASTLLVYWHLWYLVNPEHENIKKADDVSFMKKLKNYLPLTNS